MKENAVQNPVPIQLLAAWTLGAGTHVRQGSPAFSLALNYAWHDFYELMRYSPFYVNQFFLKSIFLGQIY